MNTIKTEDGFIFYVLDNGCVVDNLDSSLVDMSYDSLEELSNEVSFEYL